MKVFIENTELTLFEGAKLKDALLSYRRVSGQKINIQKLRLVNADGFEMMPDGALTEGLQLYIIPEKK